MDDYIIDFRIPIILPREFNIGRIYEYTSMSYNIMKDTYNVLYYTILHDSSAIDLKRGTYEFKIQDCIMFDPNVDFDNFWNIHKSKFMQFYKNESHMCNIYNCWRSSHYIESIFLNKKEQNKLKLHMLSI